MARLLVLTLCVAVLSSCAIRDREAAQPVPQQPEAEAPSADDTTAVAQALEEVDTGEPVELEAPSGMETERTESDTGVGTEAGPERQEPDQEQAGAGQTGTKSGEPVADDASVEDEARQAINGRVQLKDPDGQVGPEQYRDIVVYFEPAAGAPAPSAGEYEIRTERKRFRPDVLVVPVGSTVAFPNDDDILHNVFSVSPNAGFDLGRYGLGESRSHTFDETGLALIHCDVHHAMQADVLVVDTPYYAQAGDDGAFRLEDVPAGPGTLHIWHPRSEPLTRTIEPPLPNPVSAELEFVKPRVVEHTDKTGGSYRREPSKAQDAADAAGDTASGSEAATAASAAAQAPAGDNTIEGMIELIADDEQIGAQQYADTVVYYRPRGGAPRPGPGEYQINTRNKRFLPDVLAVPVGSTVAFPNEDDILHNVFSVSSNAEFDLGRYGQGESRSHTFNGPGLALIHCDVHHAMQADVLVLDTPYFTKPGKDGAFRLSGLPDGPGTLHLWHSRAEEIVMDVELPEGDVIAGRLEMTKPRVPRHLNKVGEPYRSRGDNPENPDDENEYTY